MRLAILLVAFAALWAPASLFGAQLQKARIGVLTPGGSFAPVLEGLRQRLAQLGYVEGKQISFIVEDTKMETLDPGQAVMRLLESKPHVIVTAATANSLAAKQATATVPIVFTVVTDPVRYGLVAAYASSKNNVTGVVNTVAALSGKRLQVLKEIVPDMKRALAVVSAKETVSQLSFKFLQETAEKLNVQLIRRDVTTNQEIEKALHDTPKGSVDAIMHVPSYLLGNHMSLLIDKAKKDRLPLCVHIEEMVKQGALISYGEAYQLIGIQAARLVVKVLQGIQPSEIPIETPDRPVIVVNRTTANTIGLKISRKFLEQVDRMVD
jgi:putative ABC transport system substrate-binding protein